MADSKIKYLIVDVESVPNGELIKNVKYHDDDISIDAAIEKLGNEMMHITNNHSAFIPVTFQRPICIVVGKADEDFNLVEVQSFDAPDFREEDMIRKFWYMLEVQNSDAVLITFNGRGFDVPLMELMGYKYGYAAKKHYTDKYGTRFRGGAKHIDLQEFFSNNGNMKVAGGLNLLSKLIGIPGKGDIKGSDVHQYYKDGRIKEINDYCTCDVLDTYLVFLRTRVITGQITIIEEEHIINNLKEFLSKNSEKNNAFAIYLNSWK